MSQNTLTVNSGITSVFLDLPVLESAAGITLVGADSTAEPASDDFQVGFPIVENTDFTFESDPFAPVSGSIEHSGTVTLGVGDNEVIVGDFSIGFDEARVSDTASGFFVADTTEDALGLEILFDVGIPGSVAADSDSLEIAEADLLVAPEFAEALEASELTGADIGDTRIDAASTASATDTDTFTVTSGTTSVFLDLHVLESAAGITLVDADSTAEPASDDFQVGFSIVEDTDFTFESDPFAPVSGSIEHSGTVTLGVGDNEVIVGDFSIGFDEARVSDTASGFFVADTTEDALGLEILFDVGVPGSVAADSDSLEIAEADLLVAPEFAEALEASKLTGADIGDTRIDASTASATEQKTIDLLEAENLTIDLSAVVNADNENIGGFYQAIDTKGTVIDPVSGTEIGLDHKGYVDAAIANSIAVIADGEATTLDLEGDFVYVPYLLANGEQFFSSFAEVNPKGFDNVQSLGENVFGFEDVAGGGDLDFNDFVLTVETA